MTARTKTTRQQTPLTDEQIEKLAQRICGSGDEPRKKSAAMLVLMDEIASCPQKAEDIAVTARSTAFAVYADHDPQVMDAQIQLLRSEIGTD
jgi:hypothetical protein